MKINIYKNVLFSLVIASIFISSSPIYALDTIAVSSLNEQGMKFTAKYKGIFRFSIQQGAYEPSPRSSQPDHPELWGWKTEVLIYKNQPIIWSAGPGIYHNPVNWDYLVGVQTLSPTYAEAEQNGIGKFVDIPMDKGDYLILVINDAQDCFWDNSGGITVNVTSLLTYGLFIGVDYPASNSFSHLDDAEGALLIESNWSRLENNGHFRVLPVWFNVGGISPIVIQSNINKYILDPTLSTGDNFIFYIAGHGGIDPNNSKEYILVGTTNTANYDDQSSWLRLYKDDLSSWLKGLSDKGVNVLVIIQSCHSAGFWNDALQNL